MHHWSPLTCSFIPVCISSSVLPLNCRVDNLQMIAQARNQLPFPPMKHIQKHLHVKTAGATVGNDFPNPMRHLFRSRRDFILHRNILPSPSSSSSVFSPSSSSVYHLHSIMRTLQISSSVFLGEPSSRCSSLKTMNLTFFLDSDYKSFLLIYNKCKNQFLYKNRIVNYLSHQ